MKIIDLLVKISKGEEVPKKFKYNDFTFTLKDGFYLDEDGEYLLASVNYNFKNLNDEIEIIEEEKEIEKLDIKQEKNIKNNWKWKIKGTEHDYNISTPQKIMCDKINELIDVINDMRDKE